MFSDPYSGPSPNPVERALLAENSRLSAEASRLSAEVERLTQERDEARAEVERLRADAMRYRWIKNRKELRLDADGGQWRNPGGSTFIASHSLSADGVRWGVYETLDETIDHAMDNAP